MIISSRTPEGLPNRCSLCGKAVAVEHCEPLGDAPCPHCGHLLLACDNWLQRIRHVLASQLVEVRERVSADTSFVDDLGMDSLDVVELTMELEEEFGITIPQGDLDSVKTVGDVIKYLERLRGDERLD